MKAPLNKGGEPIARQGFADRQCQLGVTFLNRPGYIAKAIATKWKLSTIID
jgi:hypothetical protein